MKIGIIGLGFVGNAVAESHQQQDLIIRDPKLQAESASIDEIKKSDGIYVCVPTPMKDSGQCDDSYVKSVLKDLEGYRGVIICKSTIPPSVYKELHAQYSNIVHCPEFSTAANAVNDYLSSEWVLVGGDSEWNQKAIDIIKNSNIQAKEFLQTNIQTAALFKYIANSFLATKVTFMNDMYQLASKLDVDWKDIKNIASLDPRLGNTHWAVPGPDGMYGYGGACFPKDVAAIIAEAHNQGIDFELLQKVVSVNNKHRQ